MRKIIKIVVPALFMMIFFIQVYAQSPDFSYFDNLLFEFTSLLDVLIIVAIGLALLFFIWGMAIFILHSGEEDRRTEGKKKMLWGIIALTVIVAIWGIVNVLIETFDIEDNTIQTPLPPI